MSTLSVWKFPDADAAQRAEETLGMLQKQELITVLDAAVVSWPADAKKPKTRQMRSMTGAGALGGSFWGFLFGLLFFVPLLGMAVGAAMGALAGSMTDVGINDEFINSVRSQVTPGTSALFILTEGAVLDRVREGFEGQEMELIHTNLSNEQEQKLREAFAE